MSLQLLNQSTHSIVFLMGRERAGKAGQGDPQKEARKTETHGQLSAFPSPAQLLK
jgi:hypothetical protein